MRFPTTLADFIEDFPDEVRRRSGSSHKAPRTGGYFNVGRRGRRGVSPPPDYMAERAVDREPFSRPNSLIYRENTGNSPETRLLDRGQILRPAPSRGSTRRVP